MRFCSHCHRILLLFTYKLSYTCPRRVVTIKVTFISSSSAVRARSSTPLSITTCAYNNAVKLLLYYTFFIFFFHSIIYFSSLVPFPKTNQWITHGHHSSKFSSKDVYLTFRPSRPDKIALKSPCQQ